MSAALYELVVKVENVTGLGSRNINFVKTAEVAEEASPLPTMPGITAEGAEEASPLPTMPGITAEGAEEAASPLPTMPGITAEGAKETSPLTAPFC